LKKEEYKIFCQNEKTLPIFFKDWWLDVVCGEDNWDVCIVKNEQSCLGVLPFYKRNRVGINFLRMPPLTQFLGPWILKKDTTINNQLTFEKKVINQLLDQLPGYSNFLQSCNYDFQNGLPFIWKGFTQSTGYTYVIEDTSDISLIWKNMKGSLRTDIKNSKEKHNLSIEGNGDIDAFISLNQAVFTRQKRKPPFDTQLLRNLYKNCLKRNAGRLLIAKDLNGNSHAAVLLVWDDTTVYYLASGSDPELRKSQALSFLLWEAIQIASAQKKKFNFEGSMVESIERHFRSCGAEQFSYPTFSKSNSKLLSLLLHIRSYLN